MFTLNSWTNKFRAQFCKIALEPSIFPPSWNFCTALQRWSMKRIIPNFWSVSGRRKCWRDFTIAGTGRLINYLYGRSVQLFLSKMLINNFRKTGGKDVIPNRDFETLGRIHLFRIRKVLFSWESNPGPKVSINIGLRNILTELFLCKQI
jgi:hypothetical protein